MAEQPPLLAVDATDRLWWVSLLPAQDREMLGHILRKWRHYFGEGASAERDEQEWAREVHGRVREGLRLNKDS